MYSFRFGLVLAALALAAPRLAAQQPGPPQVSPHRAQGMTDSATMANHRRMNDSLDARLDTLVNRMNKATGDRKVSAMAEVINELVTQRRAMKADMHRMMDSPAMRRMHGYGGDSTRADSTGHQHRHPS
jgi:hypothetical protein